jgi:hypothetical protein
MKSKEASLMIRKSLEASIKVVVIIASLRNAAEDGDRHVKRRAVVLYGLQRWLVEVGVIYYR